MENHLNPGDPKSYALRGLVPRVLEYLYASIARQVDSGGGKVSLCNQVDLCFRERCILMSCIRSIAVIYIWRSRNYSMCSWTAASAVGGREKDAFVFRLLYSSTEIRGPEDER